MGLGIVCCFIGALFEFKALLFAGVVLLIPLCIALIFAATALFWGTIEEAIPEFRGKSLLVAVLVFLFAAVFILATFFGSGDDLPDSCPEYRGVYTC